MRVINVMGTSNPAQIWGLNKTYQSVMSEINGQPIEFVRQRFEQVRNMQRAYRMTSDEFHRLDFIATLIKNALQERGVLIRN